MKIGKLVDPGYYPDGGGLYFQISPSGARSWIFRFTLMGRAREMGLGSLSVVTLAAAREEATRCRALLHDKIDPIQARDEARRKAAASGARMFRAAASEFIAGARAGWKNAKHAGQWTNTLATYAFPVIGDTDVRTIDTAMIVRTLQPIWMAKRETASRVRGRIEAILDAEKVFGHRDGDNPARWRGHLDKILPKRKKAAVKHHPAMPWADIPEFISQLKAKVAKGSRSALALHLLILCATRTNEVQFARPEEFDLKAKIWTIPAQRMKMGLPHRIPLCDKACEIVAKMLPYAKWGYLFPGDKASRPLSGMAMLELLRGMGHAEYTVHGFRSTFQDWAEERGEYADVLVERALAHTTGSVRRAYQRGDMLDRRRKMMEHWARYCTGQ